ncbi:MAG: DUF2752 domain-containing protein [Acidimicrobiales bacterium]
MLPAALPPPPDAPPLAVPSEATSRQERRAHAIGQSSLAAAGLGVGLLALRAVSIHAPACPFRSLTGVPCPGCGITRLADALAHGRLQVAVGADPAGVALLVAIAVVAVAYGIATKLLHRPVPRWLEHGIVPLAFVALIAVHWATTIVTGTLPSTA